MQHRQAHKISGNLTISSYEPGRAGKPAAGGLRPSPWGCLTAPPLCSHMGGCFLATKPLWVSTPHLSNGLMVPRQRQVRQGGSKSKCSDISLFTHLYLGQKQGEGLGAGGQIPAPALFPPTVFLPSWGPAKVLVAGSPWGELLGPERQQEDIMHRRPQPRTLI